MIQGQRLPVRRNQARRRIKRTLVRHGVDFDPYPRLDQHQDDILCDLEMTRSVPLPDNKDHPSSVRRSLTDATGASASAHSKRYRSTTTMTPEQLARKRANDRNAQRAIRTRRKAQVSQLEAELEALKNKPYACCRKLLQRNLELECELAMMKGSPLPCPSRATPTGHADEGTTAAQSPEMHGVNGQSYPNGEDSARTLLLSPSGGCDSSSETTSPVAVIYPKCGLESRDAPLQGPIAAVYAAESVAMANPALVTCGQVCPTIPSPSIPDLWPTGTTYANDGGIMDGLYPGGSEYRANSEHNPFTFSAMIHISNTHTSCVGTSPGACQQQQSAL
ncbi:bZIP transcription factor [Metarhizium robertsii ARSEF 23]|uniref:BZIP transcription factor n=1 Tax=Metarhizium robertsii (strain ARSEF 23 / ATCC MYA-3075) TaxID=655844 RepID=A0A0B2XH83_METRA|nr:bZIP transcription factor [Metarhizium robertsii ARSEF 23]KHO10922.1 bZIP transcription factor [Metarhizium robertsii ARSEF 23]